jgi:hypothetical protein
MALKTIKIWIQVIYRRVKNEIRRDRVQPRN